MSECERIKESQVISTAGAYTAPPQRRNHRDDVDSDAVAGGENGGGASGAIVLERSCGLCAAGRRSKRDRVVGRAGRSGADGGPAARPGVTVSFLDSVGNPWPVSELAGPEAPWLTVRRAVAHPHVAIVRTGAVTVVEFFDYRCGYCKRSLDAVRGALRLAGVRVQLREYPILGDASVRAARAALAAARQGAYEAAHFALMEHDGEFDAAEIDSIMRGLGLDMERLAADLDSAGIDALIDANRELAARLGVTGTPAFLVLGPGGVEVSPGALDADRLAELIAAADP